MTLLAEPDGNLVPSLEGEGSPASRPKRLPRLPLVPLRRTATIVVATLIGLLLVWWICADPIAHVWYQSRQHTLTDQTISAGSQVGSEVIHQGGSVGVLQDPTIGLNVIIAQGDSPSILRGGPGHRPGTPLPGAKGNSVVVGHAADWGSPFKNLKQLTVGATLYIQSHVGLAKPPETGDFIYTVKSVKTTTAGNVRFLAPSNDYRLTLVTNAGSRLAGDEVLVVTAVSGRAGEVTGHAHGSSLEPARASLFGSTLLRFLVVGAVGVLLVAFMRRRHSIALTVAIATPVVLLALWTLFVEFDMVAFRPLA